MKNKRRLLGVVIAALLSGTQALADGVQPVTLKVNEKEPGRFLVQWTPSSPVESCVSGKSRR